MASYHHFSLEERNMLSVLKRRGYTQEEIARELGVSANEAEELKKEFPFDFKI